MDNEVFSSQQGLHAWLEQQQAGYGLYSQGLWDYQVRSTNEISSRSAAQLRDCGLSTPAAANLRRLTLQGMRHFERLATATATAGRPASLEAYQQRGRRS